MTTTYTFSWDNKSRRIRAEIEKKLAENVEYKQGFGREAVKSKANNAEKYRKNDESSELDWLASDSVDSSNCHPVSRYSSSANKDEVTNRCVEKDMIHIGTSRISNCCKYDSGI